MKKVLIIVAVVLVLAGGGAGAYYLLSRDDAQPSTEATQTQPASETSTTGFAPASMEGVPFEATITVEGEGKTIESVMKFDGKGNSEYVAVQDGKRITMFFTEDFYYMCTNATTCFKYKITNGDTGSVDPSQYEFTEEDLNNMRATATYKGQQACQASTCDVWESTEGTTTVNIYIDTTTKRISQAITQTDRGTSTMVFEYKDVTVDVPKNAQELPSGI